MHPLNVLLANRMPALSFYFLGGIGYFAFNPKARFEGNWVYLHPLHTEGQDFPETGRKEYKLTGFNLLLGGGLQYNLSDKFILRGEALYRVLNTDYLDDVSTTYIDPVLFNKYLSPQDAALAKKLADRSKELPGNKANKPGSIRGSQKNDAFYSINLKLGMKLYKGKASLYKINRKRSSGCY